MKTFDGAIGRVRPFIERLRGVTLRERLIIFGAGVALVCGTWQWLLMDPLAARAKVAEQHLADARRHTSMMDQIGAASSLNPATAAVARNRALIERLAILDTELRS